MREEMLELTRKWLQFQVLTQHRVRKILEFL